MKVNIRSVSDAGNIEKERVILRVIAPTELGNYAILANRNFDGEAMTDILTGYWFPFKKIAVGELVILYTNSGENREVKTESGRINHIYHWGRSEPIWNDEATAALLLESPEWDIREPINSKSADIL